MIVEIPMTVILYGELIPDVISGESNREVLDEYITMCKLDLNTVSAWYETGKGDNKVVNIVTRDNNYRTEMTLKSFETTLRESFKKNEHVSFSTTVEGIKNYINNK